MAETPTGHVRLLTSELHQALVRDQSGGWGECEMCGGGVPPEREGRFCDDRCAADWEAWLALLAAQRRFRREQEDADAS